MRKPAGSLIYFSHFPFNVCVCILLQRFNVALTRARSLLIVVGNPVILNKDPTWEK